jgi:hypothetical protein
LVFYIDSLVVDEYAPIGSSRPSINPGIYLPQIPKVPKLDLRLEGVTTNPPSLRLGPGFVYYDSRYRSGYTNDGNLLASWIGREGQGGQAWATYWFSARRKLQLGYRHMEVDREFLEGGHLNDFSVRHEMMVSPELGLSGSVQYETWGFPLLATQRMSNMTVSLQLTYLPRLKIR